MMKILLDDDVSPEQRPPCSEEGCPYAARVFYGEYVSADATQGEHSQVRGWFFCPQHQHLFHWKEQRKHV